MVSEHKDVFIHETAVVDDGARIGTGTKIWHWVHVCSGAQIGENCIFGHSAFIGATAVIGNGVKVQNHVSVYNAVVLEDDVFCGPSMVFTNVINPRAHIERKDEFKETYVERGATLGANSTIVCGVRIGAYAMIGAGAVVTKNVKPFALMVGVPARQTGWVSRAGEILGDDLICSRTGELYELDGEQLVLKS